MALQVWLPLNGDCKNKGANGNIIMTPGTSVTYTDDGKLGKCLSCNGSAQETVYDNNKLTDLNYTDNFSWTLWINPVYTGTTSQWAFTVGRADMPGYGYGIRCPSSTTCSIKFGNTDYSVPAKSGEWTHVAFVKKGNIITIYVNGVLNRTATFSGTLPTYESGCGLGVGCFYYSSGSKIYPFYGKLNDLRIYDHCLSPAEVKEISRGLVLHYKLSSSLPKGLKLHEYLEKSSNVGIADYINTGVSGFTINSIRCICKASINDTRDSAFFGVRGNYYVFYKIGDNYFWPQSKAETSYGTLSINTPYIIDYNKGHFTVSDELGTVYQEATRNGTTIQNNELYIFNFNPLDGSGRTSQSKIYYFKIYNDDILIRNFLPCSYYNEPGLWDTVENKFYKNEGAGSFTLGPETSLSELIVDSSGYGNHGSITGSLTTSNNTPRYNNCSNLLNSYVSAPMYQFPEVTITFWINRNALTGTRQFIYTGWPGISIEFTSGNGWQVYYTYNSSYNTVSCSPITQLQAGVWYHCAFVIGSSGVAFYINGNCEKTNTYITPYYGNTTIGQIGNYSSYKNFNAKLSDFRIYATALSAEDVRQLYEVAGKVDNKLNMECFELNENNGTNVLLDYTDVSLISMSGWSGSKVYDNQNNYLILTATNGWRTFGWDTQDYVGQNIYVDFDYMFTDTSNLSQGVYCSAYSSVAYRASGTTLDFSQINVWKHCRIKLTADNYFIIMIRGTDSTGLSVVLNIKNLSIVAESSSKSNIQKKGIINSTIFKEIDNVASISIENIKANEFIEI